MNITEFAEQIVFGTTLEEKLRRPGRLTNDADRHRLSDRSLTNIKPGRPYGLEMLKGQGSGKPPSDNQLENEQARGQLLHFLANHELLATELMALVLLKFPDAPLAFRRGVLVTLQEEQAHTQMYLDRMAELGVEFGTYPVSGQFWRLIEPMQSPMDFVSRLSLTFEQANLDYSLHFASVFNQIGDTATAKIMDQIYRDEISHVQHGLHWFRQWKDPSQSDWDAYQSMLDFPMSPQRGRGPGTTFNREGRSEAGLTDDFINAIEVYRQSRGRPPQVFWFDPAAESELAGVTSSKQQRVTDQLHRDLEGVMIAMAKEDDIVITHSKPTQTWRKQIVEAGLELPQFLTFDEVPELRNRKLGGIVPWAWTPNNHRIAAPISQSTQTPPPSWQPDQADLFRKSFGANCLKQWQQDHLCDNARSDNSDNTVSNADKEQNLDYFTGLDCVGRVVEDEAGLTQALAEISDAGYDHSIVKQDLSASGRHQKRIPCGRPLSTPDQQWLRAAFAGGDSIVVEPELDRVVDLSFLWHLQPNADAPTFLGWTRPIISSGRRYSGTKFGNVFGDCGADLKRFVLADRAAKIHAVVQWLQPRLMAELKARNFAGYFGVDALVCRSGPKSAGDFRIKPLVELNPRLTMGHIALKLSQKVASGAPAEFRILNRQQYDASKARLEKIETETAADGRWKSGAIWLSEPSQNSKLFPVMLVGKTGVESISTAHRPDVREA